MLITVGRCFPWLALVAALILIRPAHATVYAVGGSIGCTHTTLQAAINAAVVDTSSATHTIRLLAGTMALANGAVLHNPWRDITIRGGYGTCTGSLLAGQRTVLDATGGGNGTVLDIRQVASANPRTIRLERLEITGGTGETGIGASSEGGGLELRGALDVVLAQGTKVRENTAYRAAGVLLQGGPGVTRLILEDNATLVNNVAENDGGGVWCYNTGEVIVRNGIIDANQAGRDGGGVWLGDKCAFTMGVPGATDPALPLLLSNNAAGTRMAGRGGGVFLWSSASAPLPYDVSILGEIGAPALVLNNSATGNFGTDGFGGGGLFLSGQGSPGRRKVGLLNTIFVGNTTTASGSAISIDRAIDFYMSSSFGRCAGGLFNFQLCSAVTASNNSAINIRGYASGEGLSPLVKFARTRFSGNSGRAVIFSDTSGAPSADLTIQDSIFDDNDADAVIQTIATFKLYFSTVIGNTLSSVFALYPPSGMASADLVGSILWQPGTPVLAPVSGGGIRVVAHDGCLIAHDATGMTYPDEVRVANPQLDATFTPGPSSPALDVCNRYTGDPIIIGHPVYWDAYGNPRPVDQLSIANGLGTHDLGPFERQNPDNMFANSFE